MIMTAEMVLTREKNVMLNIKHVLLKSLLVKISNVSVTNIDAMAKTIAVIILMKSDAKKKIIPVQTPPSSDAIMGTV
jgi:hypothetical protein